ncbi:unnamed protein product [Amoebophrya sp. A25]|nr:unnamed protein product [Amoebophrya sp. A25]|eukprot:GSA25T00006560001.1
MKRRKEHVSRRTAFFSLLLVAHDAHGSGRSLLSRTSTKASTTTKIALELIGGGSAQKSEPWRRNKLVSSRGRALHPHFASRPTHDPRLTFEQDLILATNTVRARAGLPALEASWDLTRAAEEHAKELCATGVFEHSSTVARHNGRIPDTPEDYIGENIYQVSGMDPTGTDVVDAWYAELDTPYHYGPVGAACVTSGCASGMGGSSASTSRSSMSLQDHEELLGASTSRSSMFLQDHEELLGGSRSSSSMFLQDHGDKIVPLKNITTMLLKQASAARNMISTTASSTKISSAAVTSTTKSSNNAVFSCAVGHFTQLMWEDTTELGCGKAHCGSGKHAEKTFAVSCRYRQGGNLVGKVPFDATAATLLGLGGEICSIGR